MFLGFDLDGVVADLERQLRKYFLENYSHDIDTRPRTFKIRVPGLKDSKVWDVIHEFLSHQSRIPPYPEAPQVLRAFYDLSGFPLYFLTARKEEFREETIQWIKRNIDVPFTLEMCASGSDKCRLLPEYITHFVEDRLRTVNELAEAGIKTFLINRPWNQDRQTHPDVTRVNDLLEVYMLIAPMICAKRTGAANV